MAATTPGELQMDFSSTSSEAVDLLVKWLYGEVDVSTYGPSTDAVNEEVLSLASELSLPQLCEVCCAHFSRNVLISNFVPRVRLCERYGLPTFRAALVATLLKDVQALQAIAQDPAALEHPALMRELLAALAMMAGRLPEAATASVEANHMERKQSQAEPREEKTPEVEMSSGCNSIKTRHAKKGA
jgi:hypothetical protein